MNKQKILTLVYSFIVLLGIHKMELQFLILLAYYLRNYYHSKILSSVSVSNQFPLSIWVIIVCFVTAGLSVKCYICNSNLDEKCGDPADKMNIKAEDCSPTVFQEAADSVQKGLTSIGKAMNIDIPEGAIGQHATFACQKIKFVGKTAYMLVIIL